MDGLEPTLRILMVEDEELIRMLAVDSLVTSGFVVEEAGTAAEAMALLTNNVYHFVAVIVDIGLPDRPGDQLLAEIRKIYPQLPIVIASGHDCQALARRFAGDRLIAVLGKPYNFFDLDAILATLGVAAPNPR